MAKHSQYESLSDHACDPYIFDTSHFENLLRENSERTLVSDDELQIKVVEVGNKDWVFTLVDQFETYLETSRFQGTRIILIPQLYSWGRLTISECALRRLIHHLNIFPAFIDVLCAFGKSTSETSDSLGGCYSWQAGSVSER
ncbi:uncharacterized protein M421DRAFT_240610 [Didymella exigua CBS 183.55]|uniref:CorA-like transporter domain-containing protein n=1 Tax=Didymella exigua CBS 183.55 TaxID=1150837 RepID=A0A6A5RDC2_9PLEO|nr:uncharacterized protein M421DRAFT_240610 [Didymella exigua CBS 183.55]KAF1925389.1 hypothetical protein M421DRAFT_240610 [Didymella exigua CBS 183.55]